MQEVSTVCVCVFLSWLKHKIKVGCQQRMGFWVVVFKFEATPGHRKETKDLSQMKCRV